MCTARWVEIELPLVKEDRDAVLREVAVAPGVGFRELDGRIGRFGHRIGDAVLGIGEQSGQIEKSLHASGPHTYLLDGDNVRHGLNKDLGFTQADRVENIRRIAEVARLMADAGLIVLVSFISPFRAERRFARGLVDAGEFCEVFVDALLAVAEARDRKGLYRQARSGRLVNFTGIDSPYEPPAHPEVSIHTTACSPEAAAEKVVARLREMGVFGQGPSKLNCLIDGGAYDSIGADSIAVICNEPCPKSESPGFHLRSARRVCR